jgi:hypothetical protein
LDSRGVDLRRWFDRRSARRWPAARQRRHDRRGSDSGAMRGKVGHVCVGELRWGLGKSLERWWFVGTSGARSSPTAPMAGGGDRLLAGACKGRKGVFIGQAARRGGFARVSCPQERRQGRGGGWQRAAVGDQWRKVARAQACALWPCGTSLGAGGVSRPVGTQCSQSPALDRRSQACFDVRARVYGSGADVARRGMALHGSRALARSISFGSV